MHSSIKRSPWFYVPSLYFQQGLPVVLVQQFSVLLYKRLGVSNDRIGLWTSLIAWPWILKMLWSPAIDLKSSKRFWVLTAQLFVLLGLFLAAFALTNSGFLPITLGLFALVAVFSATHDIALDGYYLVALERDEQAFFVGVRSTFFRMAMVFCNGALVIAAGYWERIGIPVARSWQRAIWLGAAVYGLCWLSALWMMPRVPADRAIVRQGDFFEAFRSFFRQRGALAIVGFFLFYRFAESMLTKVSGLFLLDPRSAGGLGFDTIQVGAILGNVGVISLVAGGFLGGVLIAQFGLKSCLWPMVIVMNLPNLLYIWAAYAQPGVSSMYGITAIEQFSYGFGMAPYMVYAMEVSKRSCFQTSHYAITAAFMALGAMIAGIGSGYLQMLLGYSHLFVLICFMTIPGMVLLRWIPLGEEGVEGALVPAGMD